MNPRFGILVALFSGNYFAMDLLPKSFLPVAESLDKFANSNSVTIEANLKDLLMVISPQPIHKDSATQVSLNKALAVLANLWDPRLEAQGLKLARILVEAGADPHATLCFSEINYWADSAQSQGKNKNSTEGRVSEIVFQSTSFDEARGKLRAYLQENCARRIK